MMAAITFRIELVHAPAKRWRQRLCQIGFCLLALAWLPDQILGQTTESFFFDPGLEFALPKGEWIREASLFSQDARPAEQVILSNESEDITIYVDSELLHQVKPHPDSMDWQRGVIDIDIDTFRIEMVNAFTVYFLEGENLMPETNGYIAHAPHPRGQNVLFIMWIGGAEAEADAKAREIIGHTHLRTPAEIDRALGLPYPASINLDSLYEARVNALRVADRGSYKESATEKKISKLQREDVVYDAMNGYSWENRYRIRAQIEGGNFSLHDALNCKFFERNSADIAYVQREFYRHDLPVEAGINKVVQKNCPSSIDTSRFHSFFSSLTEVDHQGKTSYWALSPAKDSLGCLLMCYWREAGQWNMNVQPIDFHWKGSFPTINARWLEQVELPENPLGNSIDQYGAIATVRIHMEEGLSEYVYEWAFNATVPKSNLIALPEYFTCEAKYEVAYVFSISRGGFNSILDNLIGKDYRPYNATNYYTFYAPSFQNRLSLASIQSNQILQEELCKDEHLCAILSDLANDQDVDLEYSYTANNVSELTHAAYAIESKKIPPVKRQYNSSIQFTDLDGNRIEELLQYKVSNGKLLDYIVLEPDAKGVLTLPKSKAWEDRILNTALCRTMIRLSSAQTNELEK